MVTLAEWQASLPSTWAFGAYWAVVVIVVLMLHQLVERREAEMQVREAVCEWPREDEVPDWGEFVKVVQGRLHNVTDAAVVAAAELPKCPPGAVTAIAGLLDLVDDLEEKLAQMEARG